jgi:hypothetical protein
MEKVLLEGMRVLRSQEMEIKDGERALKACGKQKVFTAFEAINAQLEG